MLAASEPRLRFGDSERADPLPAHGGVEIPLALLALAGGEHLVHLAEDAADERLRGLAELLFDEAHVHRAQSAAAHLLRHVHGKEAELDGLRPDARQHPGGKALLRFHLHLERLDLGLDEASDRIHQEAGFLGDFEVDHRGCGSSESGELGSRALC